jgi:photosystem II stability/assembly factor-like uncharacterized protein
MDGSWTVQHKGLEGKHISALVELPGSGILFAGAHGWGLYMSEDHGATWETRVRGLASEHLFSLSYAIVDGGVRLFAGTEPANLHISTDLGKTWASMPSMRLTPGVDQWSFPAPPHQAHLKNIAVDPRTPNTIFAAIEVGGLLKTLDGGATWRELATKETGLYVDVHRVVLVPNDPDHVYAATGNGIYHSRDGGEHWERLTDQSLRVGYPDALLMHPRCPELLFTAGAAVWPRDWPRRGSADPRVMRSRDSGESWQTVDNGLPTHIFGNIEAMAMNVWSNGFRLFAGTTDGDVYFSEDEGESWSRIASGLPVSKSGHHAGLARIKQQRATEPALNGAAV